MKSLPMIGLAGALLAFLLSLSVFIVREDQVALVLRVGEIVRADLKPGIHFKLPFVEQVARYDRRLQALTQDTERFLTSEKKDVRVDSVVRWRIVDVATFYTATRGDVNRANLRLSQVVKDRLRDEFNKRELREVVSSARDDMTQALVLASKDVAARLGIDVIDVRIKRIELPEEVTDSVFQRMRSERAQVANRLRSSGQQEAERIRAEADRAATVLLAEAERDAQRIRGEGDAKAAEIYAKAYGTDAEFYAFHRSLQAYRESFRKQGDVLVLDPNSEFFEYFQQQQR